MGDWKGLAVVVNARDGQGLYITVVVCSGVYAVMSRWIGSRPGVVYSTATPQLR